MRQQGAAMVLRGTNQEFGRPYNRRIVLESIRRHAPTTRARIAEQVGLTIQTVSTIIRELEAQGFVLSVREEPKGRGYPPAALRINPDGGYAIGIHVTPLGIEAGLVNIFGDIVERRHSALGQASPDAAFGEIAVMVEELKALRPQGRMLGVGLAMPGPFDVESMSFVGPTTMVGWKDVAVRQRLAEATGLPAYRGLDLAAAALGERLYGAGERFGNFYYLYFGVGLGGCLVHEGNALLGAWGNAGEIGHIPAIPNGDPCPCGNAGCLERYLSFEAFERRSAVIGQEAWFAEIAPIFRSAIVTIENMFDPETIILGGLAPQGLMERLADLAETLPNSVAARKSRLVPRLLLSTGGGDAAVRGAAALVASGVLSPQFGQMFTGERGRSGTDPMLAASIGEKAA
jgi:predicted NBD/HSP70 family sugar kinase